MGPDTIMDGISKEIMSTLKAMAKAKTPEEKLTHSKTVKNLCNSLAGFLDLLDDVPFLDEDEDDIPF